MNIISISDIHLCRGEADSFIFDQELSRFLRDSLNYFSPLEVVLNGDIFDLIAVEEEGDIAQIFAEISEEHKSVFEAFRKVAKSGRLVLVPGNHDHHLKDETVAGIIKELIPGILVMSSGVYRTEDEEKNIYHFEHGDAHDPWSSIISPQGRGPAKTSVIVKNMIQEFIKHPLRILRHRASGAAALALQRVVHQADLSAHERKLFTERLIPLVKRFKINAKVLWKLATSLSVRKMKKFGKIYVDIVGAEISHGEEPYYREAAKKIAQGVRAPLRIISFGHTHKPEVFDLGEGVLYGNSGTWGSDVRKGEDGKKFHEVTKGTYLLYTKETLKSGKGILNYFIPPTKRIVLR